MDEPSAYRQISRQNSLRENSHAMNKILRSPVSPTEAIAKYTHNTPTNNAKATVKRNCVKGRGRPRSSAGARLFRLTPESPQHHTTEMKRTI